MIKLYADGADYDSIVELSKNKNVVGFTTNPTLMRQAGVENYEEFSKKVIQYLSKNRPNTSLSLEVFADEKSEMLNQAEKIDSWGKDHDYDVYVKIPVQNTKGISNYDIIDKLNFENVKVNVTAVFTTNQVVDIIESVVAETPLIISIFAGRIADTGLNPEEIINESVLYRKLVKLRTPIEFLWASSREAYNYVQAERSGCDIITMSPDLIKKVDNFGKDLDQFSIETVQMFYDDAAKSGYRID
tara:strand:- start:22633 stop:23364 length:732 start_codon:yes stop_codon:yes gene_type:complete